MREEEEDAARYGFISAQKHLAMLEHEMAKMGGRLADVEDLDIAVHTSGPTQHRTGRLSKDNYMDWGKLCELISEYHATRRKVAELAMLVNTLGFTL